MTDTEKISQPIRILLIEDNPADQILTKHMLEKSGYASFNISIAGTLSKGIKSTIDDMIDVILLDLNLPDSSGVETFRKLKLQVPEMPIVILSGSGDEEESLEAVRLGAQDYLIKGHIEGDLLIRALLYAIERRKAEKALKVSEQNFRNSMDNSPLGIRIVSEDGETLYTNCAFLNIYGYKSLEEFNSTPVKIRYTPDSYVEFRKRRDKRRRRESLADNYEISIVRKDGEIRYLQVMRKEILWDGKQQYQTIYQDVTQRKRSEEALKASEEKYSTLIEQSTDGILILDNRVILFANRKMNEMTGFSQNEIIGKYFYDLAAPQYLEILHEINRKRKTGLELSVSHELELLTKDGNTVPVETKLQPIVYKGKTAGMVIVHDISERKQAEKVLRQSEQNFRNSMDKSSIGIRISDKFGNNLYANQAMMDIFGYNNQDEIQAKQPQEYYTPECYASYLLRHEKFLRNEPMPKQIQINIIRKDGTIRNLQVSMMDVFWDSQPQYQTLYQDVTEFKRVEKELYESQEKYRLIVENSTDIIFTTDVHEQFAYVSPSVKEVLGYNPDELIGKPFIFFVHPEDAFIIREETKRTYNSDYKLSRDIECRMRHANGEWRWIVSKGTKLVDSCGDLIYFIGIMRDVTELKLMEKEKRELEDKAQVASRLAAVGEMAAGIAHEINNPLTGVLGFSQMLMEKENVPEEIKGDLKLIADGSRRVADIVKRLLTFARQTKPKKELTNINDLLNNTLKLREYVLNTANIKTITRFDSDLPWTVVDPGQMQQVFLNLIVNAEQAMRKAYGTGTLSISTEKKGNNIRVLFQDDGPGISKENLKRLFEPFFTTKEVGEGTGLGLSLSRSIVLDHGGDISVESEFGHGAAFTVEIPIVEETPIEADMKNKIIQKQPYLEKSGRILVIDDEPSIRVLLEKSLTLDGYLVDVVADAGAALNKLDAGGKYDILLLDMRMAGMNGAELYAHILEKVPALKGRTIIITGDVMGTDIKSFLIKNNLPYLAKPFDINLLKKQIDIIIESTPSGD